MSRMRRFAGLAAVAFSVAANGSLRADSSPIYQCELHGQRVFSDRPCGGSAQLISRVPAQTNVYEHPNYETRLIAPARGQGSRAKVRERSVPPYEEDRNRTACLRIDQSIDRIRSKQRAGYRAKEGVRLDERLQRLEEERRTRHCR
jgi:hypothetical protein